MSAEPTDGACSGAGCARSASATATAASGHTWPAGRRERAVRPASRKALTSSSANRPSRDRYRPPTSTSASACGTRLPVDTTEASPSAAAKPATAANTAQLRGRSAGASGSRRASRSTDSSPSGTHRAANNTPRNNATPPAPGAAASPVPCSASGGPSSGTSAATATRTRKTTARPVPGRAAQPPAASSAVERVNVTPRSSPAMTEPGK